MVLLKLAVKPIKLALKLLFSIFFKLPLKIFFNFPFSIAFIFLFHVVFKFVSLTVFILARFIWPSITSHSIFADPDKLPTSTRPTTPVSDPTIIAPSNPSPTPPSGADPTPPLNSDPAPPSDPTPLPPSDIHPTPPVNQDPVPPSDANPALPSDTDVPSVSSPTTPPTAPYTLNVHIHQMSTSPYFMLVEEGVWHFANGGTWTACEGQLVLKMGGSGTSGLLRFSDGADSFFIVALGIHNYKPWLDIAPDLASDDTVVATHPDWYKDGSERAKNREAQREKVETKDKKGNALSASISKSDDHELWVTVIIGQE